MWLVIMQQEVWRRNALKWAAAPAPLIGRMLWYKDSLPGYKVKAANTGLEQRILRLFAFIKDFFFLRLHYFLFFFFPPEHNPGISLK